MEVTRAGQGVGGGGVGGVFPTPLNQGDSSGDAVGSWNSQCSPAHCTDDSFLVWLLRYERKVKVFPGGSDGKESVYNADLGLILGSGRSPGEGNGYPFQYSCLENSMDSRAWRARVHGVTKS